MAKDGYGSLQTRSLRLERLRLLLLLFAIRPYGIPVTEGLHDFIIDLFGGTDYESDLGTLLYTCSSKWIQLSMIMNNYYHYTLQKQLVLF